MTMEELYCLKFLILGNLLNNSNHTWIPSFWILWKLFFRLLLLEEFFSELNSSWRFHVVFCCCYCFSTVNCTFRVSWLSQSMAFFFFFSLLFFSLIKIFKNVQEGIKSQYGWECFFLRNEGQESLFL